MELTVEDIPHGITKAVLRGRFDTTGAIAVELPFNGLASTKPALLVDLSNVECMSSYGIRVLLKGAKIAKSKNAKLVLFCPDNTVLKTLNVAGTNDLIPLYLTLDAAIAALR